MGYIEFQILRRLRAPLVLIIVIYAVSVLGFVLIEGIDDQGQPYHMTFFEAFYFVSFMGSTIGFGEIPYPFTYGQRFWATVTIYATVISWLYVIGVFLTTLQDPAFQRILKRSVFRKEISNLNDPFYLVCGYGATGQLMVDMLSKRNIRTVVVEKNSESIDHLQFDQLGMDIPHICADVEDPEVLEDAGLKKENCSGVLAITNNDHANLTIAISSKLMVPDRVVLSRSQTLDTSANLASFGTDQIINPFETFADHLTLAIHNPFHFILYDWLVNPAHRSDTVLPNEARGLWVVCGFGRFGKALYQRLHRIPVPVIIIDPDPEGQKAPPGSIKGLGTEAETLLKANIDQAVGVVAGSEDDINNLSMIMTALEENQNLITIARQNNPGNTSLFKAANLTMVMAPGQIIANKILSLIKTPLLSEFLLLTKVQNEQWAEALVKRIEMLYEGMDDELDSWSLVINEDDTPSICAALQKQRIELCMLLKNPQTPDENIKMLPLLIKRGHDYILLPQLDEGLCAGDQILFCGPQACQEQIGWIASDITMLNYLLDGEDRPDGCIWRYFLELRSKSSSNSESNFH